MGKTPLLHLPDELLEAVIDRLMLAIGTVNGTYRPAYVHPTLPMRPFGCGEIQPLRQTCRRLRRLVEGCLAKRMAIRICSNRLIQGAKQVTASPDSHELCGKYDPDVSDSDEQRGQGWRPLQAADLIHNLEITTCYTSESTGVMPETARVARIEAQLEGILRRLSAGLVRLDVVMHQLYERWANDYRYEELQQIALDPPLDMPSLRYLRLDDVSFYVYLPWLTLAAPSLEDVVLEQHTGERFTQEVKDMERRRGASAVHPIRLPSVGWWKTLTIRQTHPQSMIYSPFLNHLSFGAADIILDYFAMHEQNSRWRQEQIESIGKTLLSSDFRKLCFNQQTAPAVPDTAQRNVGRSEVERGIREHWSFHPGKEGVGFIWRDPVIAATTLPEYEEYDASFLSLHAITIR